MPQKEYKIEVGPKKLMELQAILDEKSGDGWQLKAVEGIRNGASITFEKLLLIFERDKDDEK